MAVMNELNAWNRFCSTGSIQDYLAYKQASGTAGYFKGGKVKNEAEYGGNCAFRAEADRRKTTADNTYS